MLLLEYDLCLSALTTNVSVRLCVDVLVYLQGVEDDEDVGHDN